MKPPHAFTLRLLVASLSVCCAARAEDTGAADARWEAHVQLVVRLRKLAAKENAFGADYQPIYHAALPWYGLWAGSGQNPVDADMVSPDDYANELAGALEARRNYFAEKPGASFPLVFRKTYPDGKEFHANYLLSLPAGFPKAGQLFPLIVDLHGSGWNGHKISFRPASRPAGPTFWVTPINMSGRWNIDFLNAYLDELLAILPVDKDRVYLQGHSLGAMATWEWALANPERFAAISPRAGIGEPYRASRLKNVPAWVIHGDDDDVIPLASEEPMVLALQSQGAPVRLSVLKGVGHGMPADLDQQQVLDWYLRQSRSHLPSPPDPRDALGIDDSGFSPWEIISVPDTTAWKSQPVGNQDHNAIRVAAKALYQKVNSRGEAVDSATWWEIDPGSRATTLWLNKPRTLRVAGAADPTAVVIPGSRFVRFYGRGKIEPAFDHLQAVKADLASKGHLLTGSLWYMPLSLSRETPHSIYECRIQTN
jgi:pimeloyl-ACP methyl ester carboxylesterase